MTLPVAALTGEVAFAVVKVIEDTALDPDAVPNAVAPAGTVTFTPSVARLTAAGEDPPVTVIPAEVTFSLNASGVLVDAEGRDTVTLLATDSPGLNPVDWTWMATVTLQDYKADAQPIPPFSFELPAGTTVDLTAVSPLSSSNGVQVLQGPQGLPGDSAYEVALEAGFVGTEEEWLAILVGPEGPQGPPGSVDTISAADITDSTATGQALITAADAAAARTAIGAASTAAGTEAAAGLLELADATEAAALADGTRAISPARLGPLLASKAPLRVTQTAQAGASYTFVLADANTLVEGTSVSAQTFTVPQDVFTAGDSIAVRQYGTGQITIAAGAGTTARSRSGALKTAGRYSELVITFRTANEFVVTGDVTT